MIKYILWGLIVVGIATTISAQANRISWEYNYDHFGIKNGLPSSETYQVHQDKSGLLWILTDRGVVKYDGFEFQKYTTENGLADNVNFRIAEDSTGGVWFLGYNGLLSVFKDGKMQAYKYNHLLKKTVFIGRNAYISFCLLKDNSLIYAAYANGVAIRISEDGQIERLSDKFPDKACFFEFGDVLLCARTTKTRQAGDVFFIRNQKPVFAGEIKLHGAVRAKKYKGYNFIITNMKLYLNDKQQFKLLTDSLEVIALDADKEFLYVGFYKGGMKKYRFDPKTKSLTLVQHYLPNYSVTSAFKDSNHTLWLTTLEKGVFSISDEAFRQLAINGEILSEEVRFINGNKHKVVITHYVGKWQQLYPPYLCKDVGKIFRRFNLLPFNDGFAFQKGIVDWSDWKDVDATYVSNPNYVDNSFVVGINFFATDIIEANGKSEYRADLRPTRKYNLSKAYVWFYMMQHKKIFIVYDTGIKVFNIKNSKASGSYRSVLNKGIKKLKYNPFWGLIAISDTEGLFRIDMEEETASAFVPKLHLGKQLLNIFFDEKNQLWVVSEKGVFLLVRKNNRIVCQSFINKKLLSSAEITDLYAYDDVVYLATKFGVQKINVLKVKKEQSECPLRLFSIRSFSRNKELNQSKKIPANTDLIKINLLDKNLTGNITYRYRFGKDQTWIKSDKGEIILNNPSAGKYDLEISRLSTFDNWSKPKLVARFEVEKNVFVRWYFIVFYAAFVIVLFYIILKLSIRYVNKKNYILNRMIELEQMALSAQMNPHFIFNSLNSIHSFLLYEENENAEKYLIRFSKLIRQTLTNSRMSYITVEEEYEMLKNYILLEQMRFKNTFTFEIDCSLKQLPFHPFIPPMLIQPYVENAIIHGLIKRSEGGKLFLKFYVEDKFLKVLVQDNGIGYSQSVKHQRDTGHKSYGTQITEERLKSLKGKNKEGYTVTIRNVDASNLEFPGTCVILTIPITMN
ncbi:histidine kinase [Fluviicola sp.]|uniref:sensor histidine kinase n=1 Tax=Fluviicola sp. TaxID=1917219 RepID=UPI002612D6B4|nr:histidine kinase [Fluviicola sp.]